MEMILIDNKICWMSSRTPLTDEELTLLYDNNRVNEIKSKAGSIIRNRYSIEWQLNHPRVNPAYAEQYEWIDRIREISNEAETNGTQLGDIKWQ